MGVGVGALVERGFDGARCQRTQWVRSLGLRVARIEQGFAQHVARNFGARRRHQARRRRCRRRRFERGNRLQRCATFPALGALGRGDVVEGVLEGEAQVAFGGVLGARAGHDSGQTGKPVMRDERRTAARIGRCVSACAEGGAECGAGGGWRGEGRTDRRTDRHPDGHTERDFEHPGKIVAPLGPEGRGVEGRGRRRGVRSADPGRARPRWPIRLNLQWLKEVGGKGLSRGGGC